MHLPPSVMEYFAIRNCFVVPSVGGTRRFANLWWKFSKMLFTSRDLEIKVFATATCLSVILSVRPSVTRRYCLNG